MTSSTRSCIASLLICDPLHGPHQAVSRVGAQNAAGRGSPSPVSEWPIHRSKKIPQIFNACGRDYNRLQHYTFAHVYTLHTASQITMSMDSTSVSLLRRLHESNAEADWLRFSKLYAPLVFYWGRSQGLGATDASDLVQEVMAKLVVKLREFEYDPRMTFRGWLRTISINQARDFRRAAAHRTLTGLDDVDEPTQPGGSSVDLFERQEYCAYLVTRGRDLIRSEFEPSTWEACWKYAVEGRTAADIAQELGITANAVRIAKCRVFARLRKELEGLIE